MEDNRFDTLSRSLASRADRRGVVRRLAIGLFAGGVLAGLRSGRNAAAFQVPCGGSCPPGHICMDNVCTVWEPKVSICPDPFKICGGTCKNLLIDRANCGTCGNVCPSGTSCFFGGCASIVP